MGDIVNLNRFRKRKAREEKLKRAETNRRLHGRSQLERDREALLKKQLEDKLDGAFLLRESVTMDDLPDGENPDAFECLEALIENTEKTNLLSPTHTSQSSAHNTSATDDDDDALDEPL
jgi:hypothetical protein